MFSMMDIFIVLAAVVFITEIVFLILFFAYISKKNRPKEDCEVIAVSYYHGGGEYDDSYRLELANGILSMSKRRYHHDKEVRKKCKETLELSQKLDALANEYQMRSWTNLKKSDIFTLDEPTTSFYITFRDGQEIAVHTDDVIPDDGWHGVRELVTAMETALSGSQI